MAGAGEAGGAGGAGGAVAGGAGSPVLAAEPALRHVHPVMGTMVSFDVRIGDAERNAVLVAVARACARLDRGTPSSAPGSRTAR